MGYPFGEMLFTTGTMFTDKLFTGQREITGLGIYYYGARFYSPKLGRFLSADTIVPSYANPQNLNRFSYTLNNPLRSTDPTGHRICEDYGAGGTCLSEQQATQKYKDDLRRRREEARRRKEAKEADGGGTLTTSSTPPIPPIAGLVVIAVVLHVTTVITELGVVGADVALAAGPDEFIPELAVPLTLAITAVGLAIGDLDVAFLSYTAHVAFDPKVHQDFILLPPWGWDR